MKLFDVYPRYPINLVKGQGSYVWDEKGNKYLDLYGGHAVISIGHSHPHFVKRVSTQLESLAFYSNSVEMPIQDQLADALGTQCGYDDYHLFLCNSGAEATENAFKVASFATKRNKIISFSKGFHGRTSLSVEVSDYPKNISPSNVTGNIIKIPLNDKEAFSAAMNDEVAGVIVEGLQGLAGIYEPCVDFLHHLRSECDKHGAMLILDEVQSGYGRTGHFFAHQKSGVKADLICMAKSMGNGFPIGGILINPEVESWLGMLGTTFGGNHLACAAGLAVLEVMKEENLLDNVNEVGDYALKNLKQIGGIKQVRGRGMMIGMETEKEAKEVRKALLFDHQIFTGSAAQPNTVRILPALNVGKEEIDRFLEALREVLK